MKDQNVDNLLQQAITAINSGDTETGKQLINKVLETDPRNEEAWLWLITATTDPLEKQQYLRRVLEVNPHNEMAKNELAHLEAENRPKKQTTLQQDANLEIDIFRFPWLLYSKESDSFDAYKEMGNRGTVLRIMILAIFNSIALSGTIIFLASRDPFIRLNSYLGFWPFTIAFIFLPIVGFLVHSTAHFLCFRVVSGKGNLTAQCYLNALFTTNTVFLYWLAILIVSITRLRGLDTTVMIIGGLYLLVPGMVSLAAIQRLSTGRFIGGIALAVIASIPLYILYLFLLNFLAEARSGDVSQWMISIIFICAFSITILVIVYMFQQRKLVDTYPVSVPVKAPLREMFKIKWVQVFSALSLFFVAGFSVLDFQKVVFPPEPTLSEVSEIIPLNFNVVDAEYDSILDRIVMVSKNPNQLHIYEPETASDVIVELPSSPYSVSVGPDGKFAAVGLKYNISYIDLQKGIVVDNFEIGTSEALDVVLADNGWIYPYPLMSVEISSKIGIYSFSQIPWVYSGGIYKLHPNRKNLYGLIYEKPTSIDQIDITKGEAERNRELYTSNYPVCRNFWFSNDGQKIFTACGNVFQISSNSEQSIDYLTSIKLSPISALAHSMNNKKVLAISGSTENSANTTFNQLFVLNDETLEVEKTVTLPSFIVRSLLGEETYDANGRFIFVNSTGTRYYIIVEVTQETGLSSNFGLVRENF